MYTPVMAEKIVRFMLRLPPDLHSALLKWAENEQRSLHGQVIYLLRKALAERP